MDGSQSRALTRADNYYSIKRLALVMRLYVDPFFTYASLPHIVSNNDHGATLTDNSKRFIPLPVFKVTNTPMCMDQYCAGKHGAVPGPFGRRNYDSLPCTYDYILILIL
jgi:hypothetical protein